MKRFMVLVAIVAGMFGTDVTASAAEPQPTTISIPGLHCMSCAKKVAGELYKVSGVATVQADIKTKILVVIPKEGIVLSPKAIWEAVEKTEESPTKLTGPSGTFSAKPKS
jgi:copper chaperone CopZ